ncbi:MAG: hypothetical protein IKA91_07030 [Bacteroidaceae bacterium]|nr:hypothetical protein [Bacteroidaceae bacterium]
MKKFITLILSVIALGSISFSANAKLVDLGQMQLDTDYQIPADFNSYIGTFVAPATGTLIATGSNSTVLEPYHAQLDDMEAEGNHIPVNYDNYYGDKQYHFDITEGTTYYFYLDFSMNECTFRLSMDSGEGIQIAKCTPEAGSVFSASGGGLVSVQFNRAVRMDGQAKVVAGEREASVAVNGQANIYSMEIKEILMGWLNDGTLVGGDKFVIRLTNVVAADDATQMYGTDGTAEIEYTIGSMPIKLISTENASGTFKSYYMPDDPTGLLKLTFDGDVESALASLSFGSTDVEGDYYTETLTPIIEGKTITIDLRGKTRTPDTMVASGNNYNNITISFNRVLDTTGQYAYSDQQGSIGGFSFTFDALEVVTADVLCEFTPAPNTSLDGVAQIEIWITDEAKLSYDGVVFKYGKKGNLTEEFVVYNNLITKESDPDFEGAAILYVPVPDVVIGDYYIEVSLYNLTSADGLDHSQDVFASYFSGNAAIDRVFGDETKEFTVYNTQGILVLNTTNRDEVKNLPQGIYIINGEKFLLTR